MWRRRSSPATCVAGGVKEFRCADCGNVSKLENIAPLGHDYKAAVTAPTCEAPGYTTHTCTLCASSYTDGYSPPPANKFRQRYRHQGAHLHERGREDLHLLLRPDSHGAHRPHPPQLYPPGDKAYLHRNGLHDLRLHLRRQLQG